MKTVSIALKTALQVSALLSWESRTGQRYFVDLGLHMIEGNKDSYFSFPRQTSDKAALLNILTEDQYNEAKRLIKPLHLSDSRGAPMYTVENGFYFVQIAQGVAKYHTKADGDAQKYTRILADHLRVSEAIAKGIINEVKTKEEFSTLCDTMRPRWEDEAQTAIEFLQSIAHLSQK